MKQDQVIKGALLCLTAGVAWGGQFPIAGKALHFIDPFYFTVIRYISVAILLCILLAIIEGRQALRFEGRMKSLWFFGTCAFTVYNFLVFFGQKLSGAAGALLASIMMALIPMGSVLVMWIYKKVKPSRFTMICILIALVGVLMVITKGNLSFFRDAATNLFPALLMLIGVMGWVVYTVGGSNFPKWSPLRYTTLSTVLGTFSALIVVIILTLCGVLHAPTAHTLGSISWEMSYMIIFAGVIAVFSWNAGNAILTPINGSLFINMVPVVTFIVSIISGYKMSPIEVIGAILTIGALIANNMYNRRKIAKAVAKTQTASNS